MSSETPVAGHGVAAIATTGDNLFLRIVAVISTVAGWVSAALLLSTVAITVQMIFVRFVLNGSTTWQTEAVIYLVIGATLIGLPYVQKLRGHVNVDLVPLMLGRRARLALSLFMLALSIVIVAVMLWYAYEFWHLAFERNWRSDTIWGVLLWKPYLSLPVGLALLLLQLVADLVAVIIGADQPFGLKDA